MEMTPADLIDAGLMDPTRIIVKGELHTSKKLQEGRVRLIMVQSLIDQLIERFLFGAQNKAEIAQHEQLPSKPGMGLHDEGLQHIDSEIEGLTQPSATDAKAYDWSIQWWHLLLDVLVRIRLAGLNMSSPLARAMFARMRCLAMARMVFGDGVIWDQVVAGMMKSGSYLTASSNSRMRYAMAFLVHGIGGGVGNKLAITMGDDCVESNPHGLDLRKAYWRYGFNIEPAEDLEFCSTDLGTMFKWAPQNWAKSAGTYLQTKPRDAEHEREMFAGLKFTLRHSIMWQRVEDALSAVGRRPR